jgi:hypothetical protein
MLSLKRPLKEESLGIIVDGDVKSYQSRARVEGGKDYFFFCLYYCEAEKFFF